MRETAQFFSGLAPEGVNDTLEEYQNANALYNLDWSVRTLGHNEDGFYILLVRSRAH